MENTITINFKEIKNIEDFYKKLIETNKFPEDFGSNLDALYDSITGYLELPCTLKIIHITALQFHQYAELFNVLREIEKEESDFKFIPILELPKEEEQSINFTM
ncbi:MAG TPA: barstar family protein [Chitinophagaceae bacterium]|nr:barstar family protein [Chitinophagaceae bacterium]